MSTIYYNVKNVSAELLACESDATKIAAELFWISWNDEEDWRYTNWHETLTFNGEQWSPVTISRGDVEREIDFASYKCIITSLTSVAPFDRFLQLDVPVPVTIKVLRYFPEASLDEAWAVFNGFMSKPTILGHEIEVLCLDRTYILERDVIRMFFQPCCNWRLGDDLCGVDLDDYTETDLTVNDIDKNVLTFNVLNGPDGNPADDGYYNNGWLTFNDRKYTIIEHVKIGVGGTITLLYSPQDLSMGDLVDLTAGCDLKITTCAEKFDNLEQFSGFPFIPTTNPDADVDLLDRTDEQVSTIQRLLGDANASGRIIAP